MLHVKCGESRSTLELLNSLFCLLHLWYLDPSMFYAAISYYYELSNELVEKNYSQTTHHSTKFRNGTTRTTLFAMLALLQLSFEVLASSKPMVPEFPECDSTQHTFKWCTSATLLGISIIQSWLFFFFSQTISHYLQEKVILLLVSGSNEKKEMQYSDVRTWTKDNEIRIQAEDNNARVSFSRPFT